jgi:hypothetical protein
MEWYNMLHLWLINHGKSFGILGDYR